MQQTFNTKIPRDFLLEIGCEEIPSQLQIKIGSVIKQQLGKLLNQVKLPYKSIQYYAGPRRIAIYITQLASHQEAQIIQKQGPHLKYAYDKDGVPTMACLGFAKSCGIAVDQLSKKITDQGSWVCANSKQKGRATSEIMPELIRESINNLPTTEMKWSNSNIKFIRPVHWIVMLHGSQVINAQILDCQTQRESYGHRFHSPKPIRLQDPNEYIEALSQKGKVVIDQTTRQNIIKCKIENISKHYGHAIIPDKLLTEVTGLVEWPEALKGTFSRNFLDIPHEALITTMQKHQKVFPIIDNQGKLTPVFIIISNINSTKPENVVKGNEKVIQSRLADAQFFYHQDLKKPLLSKLPQLKNVVFQEKLGSMYDKTQRIAQLASYIMSKLQQDNSHVKITAELSKCDLLSAMVGEFPELQGIMGYYYTKKNDMAPEISIAIKEHYMPRFSGDTLPESLLGCAIALADRIDTITGIFSINMIPTGDKDPYALRRAALGIIRIIIEKSLAIDIKDLLKHACELYSNINQNKTPADTLNFIMERLRFWYADQGISNQIFLAVSAAHTFQLNDFNQRIRAVNIFQHLPEAEALKAANKRVENILKKQDATKLPQHPNTSLFECSAEKLLYFQIENRRKHIDSLYLNGKYTETLTELASLKLPIDNFFKEVLIITENDEIRINRLVILKNLQDLFTKTADLSLLQ